MYYMKTIQDMGSLKNWNEELVAYFLNRPGKKILFNVTQDVISSIHNSNGFNKSSIDSIEDFLMALCNEETGYGKKIDNEFDCKTTAKRNNGWPKEPENIFWNAYELRRIFQSGNAGTVDPQEQYFKFPNDVPPWTSHLALTILAASMHVDKSIPGNSRYPMIAALFKQKMKISDANADNLNIRIQDEYNKKFFGSLIMYRNWYRSTIKPRIVVYYYDNNKITDDPWGVMYRWAEEQTKYPGSFYPARGTITDPVTVHSKFREQDRNAMLGALKSLSPGILPSNQVLEQVIIENKSSFRLINIASINNNNLIAFREYALQLWEGNQDEIRSYSASHKSKLISSPISAVSKISIFQVMPYVYINLDGENKTKRVQSFQPRLHHTSGPLPSKGQLITIGEHKFQFYNTKYATSTIPFNSNGDLKLIRSNKVIETKGNGFKFQIYSFKRAMDVYKSSNSHVVLTQDLYGMYEWDNDDEISQGFRILKDVSRYNDEFLTEICGFDIGLDYDYQRRNNITGSREIGKTKLKLDGGSKISGGTDRRYHFENPPHFVLTRGNSSDVEFLKINPKPGEEGNHFLKEEPKQTQERGKKIWTLSLKDDIFSGGINSTIVNVLYRLKTEEALTEVSFTVVKGIDHWQLHPTAVVDSGSVDNSVFDESTFINLDFCKPISEEEKSEDDEKQRIEAEAEAKARIHNKRKRKNQNHARAIWKETWGEGIRSIPLKRIPKDMYEQIGNSGEEFQSNSGVVFRKFRTWMSKTEQERRDKEQVILKQMEAEMEAAKLRNRDIELANLIKTCENLGIPTEQMNILEIENLIATELEKHYADIAKRKRDGTYWIQFK